MKTIGEDRKLQTLHLIGKATYERKGHKQFIKLRLNVQENNNEYTT